MKTINICKSQPTILADLSADPIESVTIKIIEKLPGFTELSGQDEFMEKEAYFLEKALYFSLPGGTYDRLLGAMLTRKASHFRVAHDKEG